MYIGIEKGCECAEGFEICRCHVEIGKLAGRDRVVQGEMDVENLFYRTLN